jgi:ArsR family transcriptional regulator
MPMRDAIPEQILDRMAGWFRMLADPTRLMILRTLMINGEMSVGRVIEATGGSQANVSKHLKLMAEAGLLVRRKEGLQVFYGLQSPVIEKLCYLVGDTIYRDLETQTQQNRELLGDKGRG